MIQQTTIKNSSRQALAGLALIAAMLMACSSEHEMQNDLMLGGSDTTKVFTLNALSIDVSDDNAPFTRTTSRGDSWEDGDVVYVRNSSTGNFTPYVYHMATGLFLVRNDATAIQFTSVGTSSQEVEAYFRGDVEKPLKPATYTPDALSKGWLASDYTDVDLAEQFTALQDQSTDAKVQQSEFLYTEQDLVHRLDGTVGITLKHQVARITVKVTINTKIQEFLTEAGAEVTNTEGTHTDYTSTALTISNDPDDKIYYVGTPAFSGTEMGFTLNTKLSEPIVGHRLVQAGENIATGVTSGETTGTATYTALILPQEVGNQQLQDFIFIRVKGKGNDDSEAITYKYSLPATVTFEKGKNYTFNLQLTDGASYTNVFQDELSPSDLGKILCNDGSLIPTVAEAIDKGYTPLGHLVYYTGSKGSYTGMCMSYEDINTNNTGNPTNTASSTATTLANALTAVYNYKSKNWTYTNSDGTTATYTKPNPGGEAWCSDWFIPTAAQWAQVEKMTNNDDATQGKTSASNAKNGPMYAVQAIQNMQNKIVGADGTTASYNYTKDALPNGAYWTSTITSATNATSENTSGTEVTNNTSTSTANTRAFFYFDSRTSPDPIGLLTTKVASENCKFIIDTDNDNDGTDLYRYVTSSDYCKVIAKQSNGWWCIMPNTTYVTNFTGGTASAMIAYVGSTTGERSSTGFTHGLAISFERFTSNYPWSKNTSVSAYSTDEDNTYFTNYTSSNSSTDLMSETVGGYEKIKYIIEKTNANEFSSFNECWNYNVPFPGKSNWFLPTMRQWGIVFDEVAIKKGYSYRTKDYYTIRTTGWGKWTQNSANATDVVVAMNTFLTNAGSTHLFDYGNYHASSTEYNSNNYWSFYPYSTGNSGIYITWHGKNSSIVVRPFFAF